MQHLATLAYAFTQRKGPAKSLELSLKLAVVAPLFETGKRCRNAALRRRDIPKLMKDFIATRGCGEATVAPWR
jgi:hypothetical protein